MKSETKQQHSIVNSLLHNVGVASQWILIRNEKVATQPNHNAETKIDRKHDESGNLAFLPPFVMLGQTR
jgi:hypothetical protein